jgi:tRNA (guanine37-N1)-methyltransferase
MVMLIDPLRAALTAARAADPAPARVIYLSPQGTPFTQACARALAGVAPVGQRGDDGRGDDSQRAAGETASPPRLILLCGRYEGIDERLLRAEVDEEISIGDYVLSGGELAAAVVIDAVARLLPGALNDAESAAQDSFEGEGGLLDCPHYTRPLEHALGGVPPVLLSGNHAQIARWRRQQSLGRTWLRRPELIDRAALSKADRALLEAFLAEHAAEMAARQGGEGGHTQASAPSPEGPADPSAPPGRDA